MARQSDALVRPLEGLAGRPAPGGPPGRDFPEGGRIRGSFAVTVLTGDKPVSMDKK